MIELLLVFAYVGLSGLILWRYRQSWRAEARRGVANQTCDANETKQVRLGRLRCKLRILVEKHRASLNKPSA